MDIKMQQAINELKAMGIEPAQAFNNEESELSKLEKQLISDMETINGMKYSEEQRSVLTTHGNMAIIACAGSGKALRYGTKVLTIKGWKNIEDLNFSDKLFTYSGKEQNILGIYPQGKKRVYKVKFSDESIIDCCSEHLWEFKTDLNNEWLVENTLSIKERLNKNETIIIPNISDKFLKQRELIIKANKFNECYMNEYSKSIEVGNGRSKLLVYLGKVFNLMEDTDNLTEFLSRVFKSINPDYLNRIFTIEMANIIRDISIISGKFYVLIENSDNTYKLIESYESDTIKSKYNNLDKDSIAYYDTVNTYKHNRVIVDIEETNEKDNMVCIKVSDPSCLYIIDNFIVTHNTTVLTNLIVKRILTGEIKDFRRMICTTYSNGGATEMENRLNALLNRFNIQTSDTNKVRVYTLHAFFLHILRTFGVDKNVCKESMRKSLINEAAKEAKLELRDNDLDDLSNLISYQTNSLLTDEQVLASETNTLDNLDIKTYSLIRKSFANKKNMLNTMDFDDMQTFLYVWLCKYKDSENPLEKNTYINVRAYCRSIYDDFYVDEAQDVSKIQFEIIKSLITVENDSSKLDKNLVLVGDDDQCLVKGTMIKLKDGSKLIEEINVGDLVLSYENNKIVERKVLEVIKHEKRKGYPCIRFTTESGKVVTCTKDHKLMVRINKKDFKDKLIEIENSQWIFPDRVNYCNISNFNDLDTEIKKTIISGMGLDYIFPHFGERVKIENKFKVIRANSLHIGMIVGVLNDDNYLIEEKVVKIEQVLYNDYTYDLNIEGSHNFIANEVLVHNCIYKWRGADPSIILNIGSTFDMHIKMLSTNYRCKSNIVEFAKKSIKFNKNRYDKSIQAYNAGGKVETVICDKNDLTIMSEKAVNKIKELLDKGEKESNICVMARNNLHLAILSNMLFEQGIYCDYPASMKLTNTSMYKDIKDILMLVNGSKDSNITKRILWKLVKYMSIKKSEILTLLQNSCGLSLRESVGFILWASKDFTVKLLDKDKEKFESLKLPSVMVDNVVNSYEMLYNETRENLKVLYDILSRDKIEVRFLGLCTMYINSAGAILYKRVDKSRTVKGVCNYFYRLLRNRGLEDTLEFLRLTEQYEHGAEFTLGDKVVLTTIHSAKGKEWNNVIAFAVDSISMPSEENINKLIDTGASTVDVQDYIDEERRLYYVEVTRGKDYVYVISNSDISPFLVESNSSDTDENLTNYLLDKYVSDDSYIRAVAEENINNNKIKILEKIKSTNTEQ